jgi:predicted cation transporter
MEIKDQIKCLAAISMFAESIKPLIVKYIDRLPERSTFLFKL